jgi:hypothetical protein
VNLVLRASASTSVCLYSAAIGAHQPYSVGRPRSGHEKGSCRAVGLDRVEINLTRGANDQ